MKYIKYQHVMSIFNVVIYMKITFDKIAPNNDG